MAATLDFGAFSASEKQALLTAAKAEYTQRLTGRISSASSANQSYSFTQATTDELIKLINGLTAELGLSNVETRVRPNFNTTGNGYGRFGSSYLP